MKMFDAEVESRDLFFTLGTYGVPTNAPEWMGQLAAVATVLRECAQQGYALDVVEGQGVIRSTLGRTVFFPKSMFHRVLAFMGRLRGSSDTTLRVLPT
ncbi:hypothetical protein HY734_00355 [Candidatus Uhrbacteria bacterium]|nr:hypothetical protein [Candidatus Uhrbacteria bacterium]